MEGSKTTAWIGAILVHIALFAMLIFSVRWKQVEHTPVVAELVTSVAAPEAVLSPPPAPMPKPVAPPPPARVVPPPPPPPPAVRAPPPPPPAVKAPPPPSPLNPADIAREKAQKEADVRKLKAQEAEKEKTKQDKLRADSEKAEKDALKKQNDLRARDLKTAQDNASREQQATQAAADKLAREAADKLAAKQTADRAEAAEKAARDAATARARAKAEGDYVAKIRSKVRGNIIIAEVNGNPEAVFSVVQLPTGEVLTATLTKSSGNAAYDQAVERAILKSSPLPKPDQADVFQRQLTLKFRPQE